MFRFSPTGSVCPLHPLQVHARLDPWKTLGVGHDATEKEIKRAHRRLVLQHHPDRVSKDSALAEAKFIDIQEAYEILIGRRRGKEIDVNGTTNKNGWDWHDWYWTFSLQWRKRRSAGGGAQDYSRPPAYEMRERWKHQLFGLKAKAAQKARKRRPSGSYSSADQQSARRTDSSYKHANSGRQPVEVQAGQVKQEFADAVEQSSAGKKSETTPPSTVYRQSSPVNDLLVSLLIDAVSTAKGRHDAALKRHSQRIYSQIVKLGDQIARRVRMVKLDGNGFLNHGHEEADLHIKFSRALDDMQEISQPLYISCDIYNSSQSVTLRDEQKMQPKSEKKSFQSDKHAEKFANRKVVESRLQGQLAGLKRRAAVKQNVEL